MQIIDVILTYHSLGIGKKSTQTFASQIGHKYGNSYEVVSENHEILMKIIKETCEKNNIICGVEEVFKYMKTFEEKNNEIQVSFDI